MQLAPDLAESHEALGVIGFSNEWDWKGAEDIISPGRWNSRRTTSA